MNKYIKYAFALALPPVGCLLYTSDAADDLIGVDLGGRRSIKKKNMRNTIGCRPFTNEEMNELRRILS